MGHHIFSHESSSWNANAIASLLDHLDWPEILGTISGDDTILIICRNENERENTKNRLLDML